VFAGSYSVTVGHRISVQITSASPVSFAGSSVARSFGAPADVFGGNLKPMSDLGYAIYGGDVNQDGVVDAADMIPVDNDAGNFLNGYLSTDVNGDGIIDASDMTIPGVNSALFISGIKP
jgi:hypothetical protein